MPTKTLQRATVTRWAKGLATNTTSAALPTVAATATLPATSTTSLVGYTAGFSKLALCFFGAGANNVTGNISVLGWCKMGPDDATIIYKPVLLIACDIIMSAAVGVAGGVQAATDRDADTITQTSGALASDPNTGYTIYSPTGDTPGILLINNLLGCEMFQVGFNLGTATNLNCGWRLF